MALPHELKGLDSFVLEKVLNDGTDGGSVNVLGHVKEQEDKKLIIKVTQRPLNADKIEAILRATKLESRAPYSGAEYGYYSGAPSAFEEPPLAVDLVCPGVLPDDKVSAADKEALLKKLELRATAQAYRLVRETPRLYAEAHVPVIEKIPAASLLWVDKILKKEKEVERLIYDDPNPESGFLLNVDSKWSTHPDCATVPRDQWLGHASVKRLYCLGIVHRKDIRSVRDLRGAHLPLLRNMKERGLRAISETYGLSPDQVRVFFHYPPQFYHLHAHFTALSVEGPGCLTERAVLMDDVIDALERDPEHFAKCNLSVRAGETDPLMKALSVAEQREGADAGAKVAKTAA